VGEVFISVGMFLAIVLQKRHGKGNKKAAAKKKPEPKKSSSKKFASRETATKKTASKKSAPKKGSKKKNKLGVKNSLVNNINMHKKRGDSKPKERSTVEKKQYKKMQSNWGKDKS
jgi:hypothetical protein